MLHWFPAKVARESLSWGYSFWLGTVSAMLFLILTITGAVLKFLYVPSVERAYLSSRIWNSPSRSAGSCAGCIASART